VGFFLQAVNPGLPERALAVIYNPLTETIERRIRLPLYYSGLTKEGVIHFENGTKRRMSLARDYSGEVLLKVPARSRLWFTISAL
jgi:hypothetical protein